VNQETDTPGPQARRLWLAGAAALCVAVIAGALWWYLHRSDIRYVTAKVTAGDIRRTVAMTGALNPVVTAQVGSYVSGNIKSWSCDYNASVKIGQSCALIDPLPFEVVVDQDKADVTTAEAQLVKDRAALVYARVTYERDSKLLSQGIVSQAQIDTDKSAMDQGAAQIDLDVATIDSKKATLKAAVVNLAYTKIVSPVDGMVITRYIDVGQTVVSNLQSSTLFLIGQDMRKMQVDTNVSEADVGDVAPGQKAYFTVQAYPNRTFWGNVRQIRRGPITVQNVVTYDVVVDVDNEDMALFPGMTADAHIITAERSNVLRVPLPATRFVPEGLAHADAEEDAGETKGEFRSHREGGAGTENHGDRPAGARGDHEGSDKGDHKPGVGHATLARRGANARLWMKVNGALKAVRVRTGLDDGTLIEVAGEDLKAGDEVIVNAVRPQSAQGALVSENPQQGTRGGQQIRQPGGAGPRF
jgi:HlyD family secretion protein